MEYVGFSGLKHENYKQNVTFDAKEVYEVSMLVS